MHVAWHWSCWAQWEISPTVRFLLHNHHLNSPHTHYCVHQSICGEGWNYPTNSTGRIQWEGHYSLYNTNNIYIQKLFSFQSWKVIGYWFNINIVWYLKQCVHMFTTAIQHDCATKKPTWTHWLDDCMNNVLSLYGFLYGFSKYYIGPRIGFWIASVYLARHSTGYTV